jgi:hypothetical protein
MYCRDLDFVISILLGFRNSGKIIKASESFILTRGAVGLILLTNLILIRAYTVGFSRRKRSTFDNILNKLGKNGFISFW